MPKTFLPLFAFFLVPLLTAFYLFGILKSLSPQGDIDPSAITGNHDSTAKTAFFNDEPLTIPSPLAQVKLPSSKVLGQATGAKRIEIDLTNQRLYAYQGDTQIYNFLVSTGLWGKTPTGAFSIWGKFRYVRMTGGSKFLHTYYDLPNVPFTMFFYNDEIPKYKGFGIHGTYWHHNFGHPMSHGCINMQTDQAALIYAWADPGTTVVIYGQAPTN